MAATTSAGAMRRLLMRRGAAAPSGCTAQVFGGVRAGSAARILRRTFTRSAAVGADYPPHTVLRISALSPTMESGNLARWGKKEGEEITAGDVLMSVETDKATVDDEAVDDAFLAKIFVPEGSGDLPVGTPVGITVESADDVAAFANATADEFSDGGAAEEASEGAAAAAPDAGAASAAAPAAAAAAAAATAPAAHGRVPLIRFRHGKRDTINASMGIGGAAAAASAAVPAPASTVAAAPAAVDPRGATDVPLNAMRKVIASRLTDSKANIPHYYTRMDCKLDAMLSYRKQLKEAGIKVSVNDLVIMASALALRDVPEANSIWDESTGSIVSNDSVDISVAVATDGGLITPIVKDADGIGLGAINRSVADLASRARKGKLAPEEYQGGSFTISNLGMFGIKEFTAVINPPQACIMAVGGGNPTALPKAGSDVDLDKATVMTVTLSSDRRVVDNHVAAQFLQTFRSYCEQPQLLAC